MFTDRVIMDYWISSNNVQMGPYSLEQLRLMWQQGHVTAHAYYYDGIRSEWLMLRTLIESVRELFTPEEAFVRLGQNRQKGCLTVFNKVETLHLFVDGGFVIYAMGRREQGEFALSRALALEESSYEWFFGSQPPATNIRVNIAEYALKHAIARDIRIGNGGEPARKATTNTVALPKVLLDKIEVKLKFTYVLVPDAAPEQKLRLTKMNNLLGREEHCDIVVNSGQVSRKHCLLEVWEEHLKVKDLDSSNGTFVNGIPIRDGFLKAGDQLSLGDYKMILQKEQKKAPDLT